MKKNLLLTLLVLLSYSMLFAQPIEELENWAQQQTGNFEARDVVNFMNGSRALDSIVFGESYIFSYEYSGRPRATYLDSTHFVIVYQPEYYVRYGTAVVGTVSGNTISYGDPYVFNNKWTRHCYPTTLDSTHFVVAWWDFDFSNYTYYVGTCTVGTVSGDSISFGAKYEFTDTVQILVSNYGPTISITSLDSAHFVLAFKDYNNFGFGASKIGTVSGNIISYGPKYIFNQGQTHNISTTTLDTNLFVIAYCDSSYYITAIVGNVSGTNISYNSEYVFYQGGNTDYSISNLDTTHFVIAYRGFGNSPIGNAILGTLSGSNHTISYSDTFVFSSNITINISTSHINENQFFIAYQKILPDATGWGSAIVGNISGNNIIFGSESMFNQGMTIPSATTLSDGRVVVAYLYHVIGTPPSYLWGKANVGIISGSPVVTSVNSESSCPDTITIPITVQDMNNVTDFFLILNYDTTNLSYTGYQNFNTQLNDDSLSVTDINGEITMTWNFTSPVSISSDTLIELLFSATNVYNQTTEYLIWDDTNSYYMDSTGAYMATVFNDGQITINPIPANAGLITGADNICQGTSELIYHIYSIPNANTYNWSLVPDTAGVIIGSDTIITINFSDSFYGEAILSVFGSNTCGDGMSSSLIINVIGFPISNAGDDDVVCEGESYTLSGSASNCTHTYWNSMGDGTFDDRFILDATYTPGPDDILEGYADIILFAYAINPCLGEVGDTMILIIEQKPIAFAGEDAEICEGESYLLAGSAENYASINWTTSGDGTFDDPALLAATYTPGTNDISNGTVDLTLTATPNSPCTGNANDEMILSIDHLISQVSTPDGPIDVDVHITPITEYITQSQYADNYTWMINPSSAGIITGTDTIGTVTWNSGFQGYAYIKVTASNNCNSITSDSLEVFAYNSVGITNGSDNDIQVNIIPNPNNGIFKINIWGINNNIDLYIINSNGVTIKHKKIINTNTPVFSKEFDLNNIPKGIYYLKVCNNKLVHVEKLIIN